MQAYADFGRNEENFHDAAERRAAFAAYYGLCSWLDHNMGRILEAMRGPSNHRQIGDAPQLGP